MNRSKPLSRPRWRCSQPDLITALGILMLASVTIAGNALAQSWPTRAVKIIATSPPGGSVDLLARVLADDFTKVFGQPFVVDNRPGANGNIGVEAVVRAPADGHMLFVTIPGVFSINMHLHARMPFDAKADITPIAMIGYSPLVLVTHPSVPAKTWPELLNWLKARPGKVSYSSAGVGTTGHLGMELLNSVAGVQVVHIPYKGAAQAITDLLAGNVQVTLNNTSASVPYIQKGQLRAIAIAEKARIPSLPEVPTLHELGLKNFEVTPWFGLGTRSGVPREIVQRLATEANKALNRPEVSNRLAAVGVEPRFLGPDAFTDYIRSETDKWGEIIRRSGAKAE